MKKLVYQVDERGFIIEIYVADFDEEGNMSEVKMPVLDGDGKPMIDEEGNIIESIVENLITTVPRDGFCRARWTGVEWVEHKTKAEFDEETLFDSLTPSDKDLNKAELEITIINLLMEVL